MILNASLDTSFWNIGAQIGVIPYLFTYFRVHYCHAVEAEIVTTNPDETPLVYPQAMLFQLMQEDSPLIPIEPNYPLTQFGVSEANAIAIAREQEWVLLINDYRPLQWAQSLGIHCLGVPDFCIFLYAYAEQKITQRAVNGYLQRLVPTTSPKLIQIAEQIVSKIALDRGEK